MSWSQVKLAEICDLQNGYAFKSADYIEQSNTLSCRMSNIRPGGKFDIDYNARYLPEKFAIEYEKFLLVDGDVVIAMTDLADSPKILGVPTVIKTNGKNILLNQRVGKLVIKDSNRVYFPYLQLALNAPRIRSIYKRFAGGGLQINLGKTDLLSIKIPLPPLAEQQKIAAILDAADQLRQKDQQLIDHYTTLSQSLFLEMFGDPVTNPMGWDRSEIDSFSEVQGGLQVSVKRKKLPIKMKYLRVANVYRNALNLDEIKTINVTASELDRVVLKKYDLLIVEGHGNKKEIGRVGIWDDSIKPMVHQNHLIRVRVNEDTVSHLFLCHFLNSQGGRLGMIRASNTTSGLNTISTKIVKNTVCLIPPVELQNQFAQHIEKIEQQKQQAQASLEKSEVLFNSLLQRAFKGELTQNSPV